MRAIDADKLKEVLEKNFGHTGGASVLAQLIDAQDTIHPEPHWIPVTENCQKKMDATLSAGQRVASITQIIEADGGRKLDAVGS